MPVPEATARPAAASADPMTDSDVLYLGVDGGGSTCRLRLAAPDGAILAEATGGPANVATDLSGALASFRAALDDLIAAAGLERTGLARIRAGFGMAGANVPGTAEAFAAALPPFASVAVSSDAEIACLGAHGDRDGAILILGTGSQGIVRTGGAIARVGGWGFMLSDGGSGAVLGHAAARRALLGFEALAPSSPFCDALMDRFDRNPTALLAFSRTATPADWARFAPLVFAEAAAGDPVAQALRDDALGDVAALVDRLVALGANRVALVGGLAAAYRPHLPACLTPVLVPPEGDALDGALRLAGLTR